MVDHIQIPEAPRRHTYSVGATPTTGPFNITFPFMAENDISAFIDGVEETNFTLDNKVAGAGGIGYTSATLNFLTSISSVELVIRDNTAIERTDDFPFTGPFSIRELNTELDRHVIMMQRLRDQLGRTLIRDEDLEDANYDGLGYALDNIGSGFNSNSAWTATQIQQAIQDAALNGVNPLVGVLTPFDFGALGDDDALDHVAIQDMFDQASITKAKCVFPAGYTFKITQGVVADGTFDIQMDSPIKSDGGGYTAILVGTSANVTGSRTLSFWVSRATYSDWTDENDTGVELRNLHHCRVYVRSIVGYTNGLVCHADASVRSDYGYIAWCRVDLGGITSNRYGVKFKFSNGGGGIAFINENAFWNGNFSSRNTAVPTSQEYFGFHVDRNGMYTSINTNRFRDNAFEMNYTNALGAVQSGVCFYLNAGTGMLASGSRIEACALYARCEDEAELNRFGYALMSGSIPELEDTSIERSNFVINERSHASQHAGATWDSGFLPDQVTWLQNNEVTLRGFSGYTYTDATPNVGMLSNITNIHPDFIGGSSARYGFGCLVDVRNLRHFAIYMDTQEDLGSRINLQARDKYHNVIHGTNYGDVFACGNIDGSPWIDYGGDAFPTWGAPGNVKTVPVSVIDPDVAYIYVCFAGAGSTGGYRRVRIKSLETRGSVVVTSGIYPVAGAIPQYQRFAYTKPLEYGFYALSEIIIHAGAVAGDVFGWRCTTAGWLTNDAWAPDTPYVVGNVRYNGTDVYAVVEIAGTGTSASSGGPTGQAAGEIIDNPGPNQVSWKFVSPLAVLADMHDIPNIANIALSSATYADEREAIEAKINEIIAAMAGG